MRTIVNILIILGFILSILFFIIGGTLLLFGDTKRVVNQRIYCWFFSAFLIVGSVVAYKIKERGNIENSFVVALIMPLLSLIFLYSVS